MTNKENPKEPPKKTNEEKIKSYVDALKSGSSKKKESQARYKLGIPIKFNKEKFRKSFHSRKMHMTRF